VALDGKAKRFPDELPGGRSSIPVIVGLVIALVFRSGKPVVSRRLS